MQSSQTVHSSSTVQDLEGQSKKSYEGSVPALSSVEDALSTLSQASDGEGPQIVLDKFFNSLLSSEGSEEQVFEQCTSLQDLTETKVSSQKAAENYENNDATSKCSEDHTFATQLSVSKQGDQIEDPLPETDEDFQNMLRESAENFESVLRDSNESFQQMLRESVESFRNEVQESEGHLEGEDRQFHEDLQNLLSDLPTQTLQEPNATQEEVTIHMVRKRKASATDSNILTDLSHLGDEDPDRMFLLSVVPDLKRIRRDRIDDVKLKILQVIKKNKSISTVGSSRSSMSSMRSFSSDVLTPHRDVSQADGEPLTPDPDQLMNSEPLLSENEAENPNVSDKE